ncbi:MAG: hypothetical protein NTW75_02655 [Planctomycetales bacterium]|nr:hypothetical protein [Planctomycetales bacterium]
MKPHIVILHGVVDALIPGHDFEERVKDRGRYWIECGGDHRGAF